jgi:hypothetical protein
MTQLCNRTGIEFEAASKRQKNHPVISEFLSDQAKHPGRYSAAVEACEEIKANGVSSIEEAMAILNQAVEAAAKDSAARRDEIKAQIQQAKDRRSTNAFLRSHGYRWIEIDAEALDAFSPDGKGLEDEIGWHLISPDGNEVTVEEAKRQIAGAR